MGFEDDLALRSRFTGGQVLGEPDLVLLARRIFVFDFVHQGSHQIDAQPPAAVVAEMLFEIRKFRYGRIEGFSIVNNSNLHLIFDRLNNNLNFAIRRKLVRVFNDICACFVNRQNDL